MHEQASQFEFGGARESMSSMELQMRPRAVCARFSAAAGTYDDCAVIQERVAGRIVELMSDVQSAGPILEIGCGTGLLTRKLAKASPTAEIHALDISGRMIEEAARRLPLHPRVSWIEADLRDYSGPRPYPVIVSSSSLHWIEPLGDALAAVSALAGPGSCFVAVFMLRDSLRELHQARRHAAPGKEPAARLGNFETIREILGEMGWTIRVASEDTLVERHASARALLRSLHDRGVTGGAVSRSRYPLTRGDLNRLKDYYDAHNRHAAGGVAATYHVGSIKAVLK